MISNKPYIIRAMYDWIVDNGWTPHLQVDANYPGVNVPQEYVQEGVIVLNMMPSAVIGLTMDNQWFSFKARFKGIETKLGFSPEAVLAIFARENGQGMPFPPEPYPEELLNGKEEVLESPPTLSAVTDNKPQETATSKEQKKKGSKSATQKKPTLTVVK
ncbi:Stringent starvation protein B [hydrothermal vent metagenome]|uniref:Stringent starvation protein B n=1 Tax=hydrothermal vent metagenome TaxID=652676 RepID=A0A3B0W238_9ZZZZ